MKRRKFPDRLGAFAVDVLAVHRLTRLATADEIARPLRDRIIQWAYTHHHRINWQGRRTPSTYSGGRAVVVVRYESDDPLWSSETRREYDEWVMDQPDSPPWATLVEIDAEPPKLATLVSCRWCMSVWIAAGVCIVRRVAPRVWAPVAYALAASSLSTLLARLEDD